MAITKYIAISIISSALILSLQAKSAVFASQIGSKDELDVELRPVEDDLNRRPIASLAAKEPAAKVIPQKAPQPQAQPGAVEEKKPAALKSLETQTPKPAEKKIPEQKKPVEKKAKDKKPPEQKKPVEKKAEAKKEPEQKRPVEEKAEAVKPPEQKKPSMRTTGIINKWFGIETGVTAFKKPAAPPPEKTQIGKPQAAAEKAPDDIFTLKDCVNIAIKNNLPLQTAEKSVKLARMRVLEARRNMLPTATITYEPYSGKVGGRNYVGKKEYVEGKQPIFHGGELYFTVRQAETNLEITKNEADKIQNELTLQVKKAYYSLAKAQDNLLLQTELSGEVERMLQMVSDEYDAKVASKLELLNVSSQASQVKYQLVSADGDVSVAELILKQAMNIDPEIKIRIKPRLEFSRIKVRYENVLAAALTNRPEIRINTLMIEYYAYGKRIAGAKTMPKIDLMGSWGLAFENYTPRDNANDFTGFLPAGAVINPIQKPQEQWYAGVKTSLPIWGSTAEYSFTREQWTPVISAFQGTEAKTNSYKFKLFDNLAMYSDIQLSEIDFDRARQELNKLRQDITLEVREQCFNYNKALIQLDTASNKVRYQENDFELVKMKRGMDEVPDSNVIETMIKFSQEKFGYVQALADCHTALASINKAIGVEDYFKDE